MQGWLNNPWVIGIGGGVLSGLLVTTISRYLLSRRESREHVQKVAAANQEILYAIRPGISEGRLPSSKAVLAMTAATARRQAVDSEDLFGPNEISQELVKEVMDSSFLSAEDKHQYCEKLAELDSAVKEDQSEQGAVEEESRPRSEIAEYREKMTRLTSMMMGLLAMTMTVFMTFYFTRNPDEGKFDEKFSLLLPAVLTIGVVLVATMVRGLQKELNDRAEEKRRRSRLEAIQERLAATAQPDAEADG